MSESTQALAALYEEGSKSAFGKHLINWIEQTANSKRKNASRSQDTAYGELKFADGMESVVGHIEKMKSPLMKAKGKAS